MAEATIKPQRGQCLRVDDTTNVDDVVVSDVALNDDHSNEKSSQRYANVTFTCVNVEEAFLGFLNVDDSQGPLFDVTHNKLKSLGLDIDDIRMIP
ncbi:hypothetical protein Tco_1397583 [Tanacetum coccineum]